jgi:chromosome segregation ATPase
MTITKLAPFLVSILLVACGGSSPPPASPPPADSAGTGTAPGATEGQDDDANRVSLKSELASLDASLDDLGKRIEKSTDAAKADLQAQLAGLQKRRDVVKAQLQDLADKADDRAVKVRREARTALKDLQHDLQKLADRLKP